MNIIYINKLLSTKRVIKKMLNENLRIMQNTNDPKAKEFWEIYKSIRDKEPIKVENLVSYSLAQKNSGLDRRAIKRLVNDGILRSQDEKVNYPDVVMVRDIISLFEESVRKEIIKETTMMGSKKYLMLDFSQDRLGKSLPTYQTELMLKLHKDFFSKFYELKPKEGVEIPEKIKEGLKS